MKKFCIVLIALLLVNGAMGQWFPQNSGTMNYLNSVYFTDANVGYAVGDSGTILKTTDGGLNWVAQNSGSTEHLFSIHFPSANAGYVVGGTRTILKTIDWGVNWTSQIIDTNYILISVFFTNNDTGYIVGQSDDPWYEACGVILKTTDGGNIWTTNFTYPDYYFRNVCFPSDNTGYVMGAQFGADPTGIILKTNNGGAHWDTTFIYYTPRSPCMLSIDTGYAICNTMILRTNDGWVNWTGQQTKWLWNSLSFTNTDIGYGVGDSSFIHKIVKTTDGGNNWEVQDSTLPYSAYSIFFPSTDTGYIVGENGMILKTTNGGGNVGINNQYSTSNYLKIYPNPTFTTITIEPHIKGFFSILNLNGQQLLQQEITEQTTTVDVSDLPSGIYILKLFGEKGVQVSKFIKN